MKLGKAGYQKKEFTKREDRRVFVSLLLFCNKLDKAAGDAICIDNKQ